jgi:hypothetical protein
MTDIREKIKLKIERDAHAYDIETPSISAIGVLLHGTSYAVGANIWAEKCLKLVEAVRSSIARSEEYGDLYCSQPICQALEAFKEDLE